MKLKREVPVWISGPYNLRGQTGHIIEDRGLRHPFSRYLVRLDDGHVIVTGRVRVLTMREEVH